MLALAHTEGAAAELIVIGSFPGRPSFAGLGELTANELETLWLSPPSFEHDNSRSRRSSATPGSAPGEAACGAFAQPAADPSSALTAAMSAPPSVTAASDRMKLVVKNRWRR